MPVRLVSPLLFALAAIFGVLPDPVVAAQPISRSAPLVVGNDPGGRLRPRIAEVNRLRANGRRVEIRGDYCMSACTIYLGVATVCVSPRTQFGFHGPSFREGGNRYARFDRWSRIMAAYYPAPVRGWFLSYARFLTKRHATVSGLELIQLGVPRC